jgi:hypothetical protein
LRAAARPPPVGVVSTPTALLPLIASGAQVVVRDEEWLVSAVEQADHSAPPFTRPDREADMTRAYETFIFRMGFD